ncbi:kinase-like protein [Thozetella sp. PMI_491]|nr:kinase-like protein [Thozetella sp. PMI_491]
MAIRRAFLESASSGGEFLPLHSLAILINQSTVGRLLELTFPSATAEVLKSYTAQVCGPELSGTGRRKIFAIVVLMNRIQSITDFIDRDILDFHLPLEAQWSRITNWSRNDEVVFSTYQACMLAPFFQIGQDKVFFYKLPLGYTLPFIEYKNVADGGYSRVRKVKIHPAHHNLSSPRESNPYFALKSLHTSDYRQFCEEVKVLQRFSGVDKGHSHLTRLLLAYQHNGTYHLLFDWADGNLREFWEQQSNPSMNVRTAHWIVQQCLGLTQGLRRIHHTADDTWEKSSRRDFKHEKSWGRHGDLKPENILWFNDASDSRLVISDFGLSRYHSYRSKSADIQYEGFSPTYRPPECDLHEVITQRYDIWTLGCLFLEFLTWYILGFEAVNNTFPRERIMDDYQTTSFREDKFFNVVRGDNGDRHAELKNSVKEWIRRLHVNENCPEFVHSFLDIIEDHLLVPRSSARWDSDLVYTELKQIYHSCRESEEYCVQGIPRRPSGIEDQGALMVWNHNTISLVGNLTHNTEKFRRRTLRISSRILSLYHCSPTNTRQVNARP